MAAPRSRSRLLSRESALSILLSALRVLESRRALARSRQALGVAIALHGVVAFLQAAAKRKD